MNTQNIGKVVQVIGPVLDIRFEDGHLPELLSAIEIMNGNTKVVAEVAQHIGDNVARCISMNATDGMVRGLDAVDTGSPITVPVGTDCLGRIFNLLGEAIDDQPQPENAERWPIHRAAPSYEEQETSTEILETGIKVRSADQSASLNTNTHRSPAAFCSRRRVISSQGNSTRPFFISQHSCQSYFPIY